LTNMTNDEMIDARKMVMRKRKQVRGRVYVNDYTSQILTPNLVQHEVEVMRSEGLSVDFVMIDYLEIMHSDALGSNRSKKHEVLASTVVELRRVANALDVPILSAWQVNRAGSNKFVFGPEDISECWDAFKHADSVLGLNQTDLEAVNNVMRIKIMKQREDTERAMVYLHSDLRRMRITQLNQESE
jgi:replicative DNA helicase